MLDDAHPVSSAPAMTVTHAARTRIVTLVVLRSCCFLMVLPMHASGRGDLAHWRPRGRGESLKVRVLVVSRPREEMDAVVGGWVGGRGGGSMSTTTFARSIHIDAPVETVFDYVKDPRHVYGAVWTVEKPGIADLRLPPDAGVGSWWTWMNNSCSRVGTGMSKRHPCWR